MTGVQTCALDRKSTRLNSSHTIISYAVFCLKKKKSNDARPVPPPSSLSGRAHASGLSPSFLRDAGANRGRGGCALEQLLLNVFFFLKNRGPPKTTTFPQNAPLQN